MYKVPEIVGYSKAVVVDKIHEMVQAGYLKALPLHIKGNPYPIDFKNIKITTRGSNFISKEQEESVQTRSKHINNQGNNSNNTFNIRSVNRIIQVGRDYNKTP
ncbi:MAG: hypothetical protein RMY34_08425 [Aulosira sp. DedQUE10]|nr:hypothetical protein [Aulosira sp. DedQUE10]